MISVLEEFRLQSRFCGEFGSPFTEQLLARCAEDIEAGGIVARLTDSWPGHPPMLFPPSGGGAARGCIDRARPETGRGISRSPVRLVDGPDLASGARFHGAGRSLRSRDFMNSPPQTNETARATGLACGFLWLADRSPQPLHLLELGASAE